MKTSTAPALPAGERPTDWLGNAACRDVDPELFFPVSDVGGSWAQVAAAKQVCGRCPVRGTCLSWALDSGQEAGIWGGMTEEERRMLRRRRHPPGSSASRSRPPYPVTRPDVPGPSLPRRWGSDRAT